MKQLYVTHQSIYLTGDQFFIPLQGNQKLLKIGHIRGNLYAFIETSDLPVGDFVNLVFKVVSDNVYTGVDQDKNYTYITTILESDVIFHIYQVETITNDVDAT